VGVILVRLGEKITTAVETGMDASLRFADFPCASFILNVAEIALET
jgi:hypothetical protein